ncbi:glycosyltransferase [Roseibium suaedae]|uniref:Glycosyltransferase family 28 C-terminal domain-containing protein n=1 Tax=Roseibium suaedae TaxID=735517 RepID=A0A1M7P0E6_9HYPH|nr:glycosyltransferase [Roseibium suaedae]SHN09896.1 Glycosyltransferase family 28 C-terminal domain-containing protein [Roseibium suaedae]
MTAPVHVVILYTDAGGGHRASACALKACLEATGRYRVTLLNPYLDLIAHLDLFSRFGSLTGENIYNEVILRKGRTGLGCWLFYAALRLNYVLCERPAIRILARHFEDIQPDIALSVMPLGNKTMLEALKRYRAGAGADRKPKGAVMITDWAELAPGVWFPNRDDYHAICGTEDALRSARKLKRLKGKVHAMGGLLIRPEFTDPALRKTPDLPGFDPARPVVTVLYGAQGSQRMLALAEAMANTDHDAQVVFLCGRNAALRAELAALDLPYPNQILGFTDRIADYLAASDLFIGKPGPGCTSEALALGLSPLLDRSLALPQEAAVLSHVQKTGLGRSFATMDDFQREFSSALKALDPRAHHRPASANSSPTDVLRIIDQIAGERHVNAGATAVKA